LELIDRIIVVRKHAEVMVSNVMHYKLSHPIHIHNILRQTSLLNLEYFTFVFISNYHVFIFLCKNTEKILIKLVGENIVKENLVLRHCQSKAKLFETIYYLNVL